MSYSFKRVLLQHPNKVTAAIIAVLNVFIVTGIFDWSGETVAVVEGALVLVLGLLYADPLSVSKDGLKELEG